MSSVIERKPKVSRFSATDPNLAFLASKAAIELGRVIHGRPTSVEAVTQLGNLLLNSANVNSCPQRPTAFMDPTANSLIHSAVKAAGSSVSSNEDLFSEALKIARELGSTTDSTDDPTGLKRLRAFCIGLADSAMARDRSQIESYFERAQWS